jgi:hypothetical protein
MLRIKVAILTLLLAGGAVYAEPATAPSPEDQPAPVAMAPTYLAIGKELLVRVAIIRQTLGDLSLSDPVRKNATQVLDDAEGNVRKLLHDVESGNMPTQGAIAAVPENMRAAHAKLLATIGSDQSALLEQNLRSLRGEARGQLAQLAQDISDKNLTGSAKDACDKLLAEAEGEARKLPATDGEGDQYIADRKAMEQMMTKTDEDCAKVLGPVEQSNANPTTQPTPRS